MRWRSLQSLIQTGLGGLLIASGALLISTTHAIAPERDQNFVNAVWLAESKSLLKVDATTGQILLDIPVPEKPNRVAVDDHAGVVWTYDRGVLIQTSFSGTRLSQITVPRKTPSGANDDDDDDDDEDKDDETGDGHVALTVEASDSDVWLARNKTLFRLNADGALQFKLAPPPPVSAFSLDTARRVLWVAMRKNLLAYDTRGIKVGEILTSPEAEIRDLAIDTSLASD